MHLVIGCLLEIRESQVFEFLEPYILRVRLEIHSVHEVWHKYIVVYTPITRRIH